MEWRQSGVARSPLRAGVGPNVKYSKALEARLLVDMMSSLTLSHQQRFFDRRVERVVWSPRCRTALAVGSHGGDVYLWNYENEMRTSKIVDGCGRGGAINDMKFSHDGESLFAVGHDGHITAHDTETAVAVHSFGTTSFGSTPRQVKMIEFLNMIWGCVIASALLSERNSGRESAYGS